jgi:hypothetical protein
MLVIICNGVNLYEAWYLYSVGTTKNESENFFKPSQRIQKSSLILGWSSGWAF